MKLDPKKVQFIVIHCADTTPSMKDVDVAEIDRWHRKRGFLKVGYHYVIKRDGVLEIGRQLSEVGAHVTGWNEKSIGICLVGGAKEAVLKAATKDKPAVHKLVEEDNFTEAQWATLTQLLLKMKKTFANAKIIGHRDLNPYKYCPSFNVKKWVSENPALNV